MKKCPICGFETQNSPCSNCGYDESRDIVCYRTVKKVSGADIDQYCDMATQGDRLKKNNKKIAIERELSELKIRQLKLEQMKIMMEEERIAERLLENAAAMEGQETAQSQEMKKAVIREEASRNVQKENPTEKGYSGIGRKKHIFDKLFIAVLIIAAIATIVIIISNRYAKKNKSTQLDGEQTNMEMLFSDETETIGNSGEMDKDLADLDEDFKIGICQFIYHDLLDEATEGFKDAIVTGGISEYYVQNANADLETCTTLLEQFFADDMDLILGVGTIPLQAAAGDAVSESGTPVLGTCVSDYGAALGIDYFDGTVGGHISGTTDTVSPEALADMTMEVMDLYGGISVAIVVLQDDTYAWERAEIIQSCLEDRLYAGYIVSDLESLVLDLASGDYDAICILGDYSSVDALSDISLQEYFRPIVTDDMNVFTACGTFWIRPDYYNLGYKTGEMACRILIDGEDISQMPIAYATEYIKFYNAEWVDNMGLAIPKDYIEAE